MDYLEEFIKKVNEGVPPQDLIADRETEAEGQEPSSLLSFNLPRRLWEQIRGLPEYKAGISGSGRGRPRLHSPKKVFSAILAKAFYGCSWREIEEMFGIPAMTAHDQFRRWKKSGLFEVLQELRVQCHHGHHDIDWTWIKFFDRFKEHLAPEREPRESTNEEDERMLRLLTHTARRTPRKNDVQVRILRRVRDHFQRSA